MILYWVIPSPNMFLTIIVDQYQSGGFSKKYASWFFSTGKEFVELLITSILVCSSHFCTPILSKLLKTTKKDVNSRNIAINILKKLKELINCNCCIIECAP